MDDISLLTFVILSMGSIGLVVGVVLWLLWHDELFTKGNDDE